MNPTPEQVQEVRLRIARSDGAWIGILSAGLFCLTIGFLIFWLKAGLGGFNPLGDPHSGKMTNTDHWSWGGVSLLTMVVSAVMGRVTAEAMLDPDIRASAFGAGMVSGFVVSVAFTLGIGVSIKLSGGGTSWGATLLGMLQLGMYGCVVALPWGIATAALIGQSLKPKPLSAKRDFSRPTGGEGLEE